MPTSTEDDKIQDMIDQESLDKCLREGNESQSKLRLLSRTKHMMEDKIKEQDLLSHSIYCEVLHEEDSELKDRMNDPIVFKAANEPDTMFYHEAMKASYQG